MRTLSSPVNPKLTLSSHLHPVFVGAVVVSFEPQQTPPLLFPASVRRRHSAGNLVEGGLLRDDVVVRRVEEPDLEAERHAEDVLRLGVQRARAPELLVRVEERCTSTVSTMAVDPANYDENSRAAAQNSPDSATAELAMLAMRVSSFVQIVFMPRANCACFHPFSLRIQQLK